MILRQIKGDGADFRFQTGKPLIVLIDGTIDSGFEHGIGQGKRERSFGSRHFFYGAGCLMHQRAEQDGCFAFRGALACSVLEKPVVDDCFEFKQDGPVECENSAQVVERAGCAPGAGVQNLEQIEPVVFHLAAKRLAFVRLSVCGLFFLCDGVLESVDFLLHADHFLFQSVAVSLEFGEGDVLKVVSGCLFGDRQSLPVQRIGHDRPVENS